MADSIQSPVQSGMVRRDSGLCMDASAYAHVMLRPCVEIAGAIFNPLPHLHLTRA